MCPPSLQLLRNHQLFTGARSSLLRRHSVSLLAVGLLAGLIASLGTVQRTWQLNQLAVEAAARVQDVRPLGVPDLLGLTERPQRRDWHDLIEHYKMWLDRAGMDREKFQPGMLILQNLLLMAGQPEEVMASPAPNNLSRYFHAVAYSQQHDRQAEIAILRKIPDSRQALTLAGRKAWDNRFDPEVELAIGSMKMLLELGEISSEQQIDAYRILSGAYELSQQPAAALEAALAGVRIAPADCAAVTRLITLYLRQTDPYSASDLLQQQTSANRPCPAYFRQMAMTQDQLGNLDGAVEYYQRALADEPDNVYLNGYYGNLLYRRKEYSQAIQYLTIAAGSNDPDLRQMAADLLARISQEPAEK